MPVFVGAAGPEQLGEETEAVLGMSAGLEESRYHLLSLGPVTNTASLLQLRPDLHDRIESIIVVAGRRPGQRFLTGTLETPLRDFNFERDPLAMQVLLDSEIPLVMAPWEVSSHVWLRQADLDGLAERSASGAWVKENTATWIERWKVNFEVDGFNPFDTLAVGWLTHPQWMERFEGSAWIEEGEDDRAPGSGTVKPYLLVEQGVAGRQVTYLHTPSEEFQPLLVDRLAEPGKVDAER
jgi:pyrimidine-specific ribonucleoside hydrolase